MKISYLFAEFGKSGGPIVLYNFMDNLVSRGHEIHAILPNGAIKWEMGIWKEMIYNQDPVIEKYTLKMMNNLINFFEPKISKNKKNLLHFFRLKKLTNGLINNWVDSDVTIATHCLTAYAVFYLSDQTVPIHHMQHFEELFFKRKFKD